MVKLVEEDCVPTVEPVNGCLLLPSGVRQPVAIHYVYDPSSALKGVIVTDAFGVIVDHTVGVLTVGDCVQARVFTERACYYDNVAKSVYPIEIIKTVEADGSVSRRFVDDRVEPPIDIVGFDPQYVVDCTPTVYSQNVCVNYNNAGNTETWNVVEEISWYGLFSVKRYLVGTQDVTANVVSVIVRCNCPDEPIDYGTPACVIVGGVKWNVNRAWSNSGVVKYWDMDTEPPTDVTGSVTSFVANGCCC